MGLRVRYRAKLKYRNGLGTRREETLQPFRTETGLRLVLMSLAVATVGIVWPRLFVATVLADPYSNSLFLRVAVLGSLTLGLGGGTALLGFAGIAIVERNRGRTEEPTRRKWDRPRLAALASIVAGGLFFLPGLIVGFVYLPGYVRIVFAVQIAGWLALSVSVGVYLFLTARRIDQAVWRLSLIALAFGLAAAGLTTILTIAAQTGYFLSDFDAAMILNLSIPMFGILSLLTWIVVYARILGRFPFTTRPTIAVGQA